MKEQNNKNTDKKIVTLKKSNTSNSYNSRIRIKFKPNNKYKSRHYKSKRIRIRHPWYNKKRQLTTLPSTIIYDAFNKNLSFHNPATPSLPIQPPIEKYSIDRLLSMGYPLLRARELTWLLKYHSRYIGKEEYKYKRAFESIQKANKLEKEGYKHWTVRRDEKIAEAKSLANDKEKMKKENIENMKKENMNKENMNKEKIENMKKENMKKENMKKENMNKEKIENMNKEKMKKEKIEKMNKEKIEKMNKENMKKENMKKENIEKMNKEKIEKMKKHNIHNITKGITKNFELSKAKPYFGAGVSVNESINKSTRERNTKYSQFIKADTLLNNMKSLQNLKTDDNITKVRVDPAKRLQNWEKLSQFNVIFNLNDKPSQSNKPITQLTIKKDVFDESFKSFVRSVIWKRDNAVSFSSLALDKAFSKLFTSFGMKSRFVKASPLYKLLQRSRLYKLLLGHLRNSIKINDNKLANLCRLSIMTFLSYWVKSISYLNTKLNHCFRRLFKQFYLLTYNLSNYNWRKSRPRQIINLPLKVLKPGLNKRQIQTKRDFYDKSLRKLLWWYTSGKLETAHKNVKKRLTAKLERVFYIRSYIFRDIFIFNNLKYLQQPVLVNKFIYNTLKKRRLFRLLPRLHVYSPTAVLHYWKFMMFYGNVNTFGLNWANTYISSLYRNLRKPRLYLKSLYGVQLYKFLLFSNHKFSPFFFTINHYLAYKKHLNTLSKIGGRAKAANIKYLSMPLADKIKRLHLLDNNAAVLYGYKFHFVGRFTRKQQSANLWFTKGSLATSAYSANIDYATYTVTLRYSACTIKVWLYRPINTLKYTYRIT